jgi:hypothetical protein
MSYCRFNHIKYKEIVDDIAEKIHNIINEPWRSKTVIKYRISEKGREISNEIDSYRTYSAPDVEWFNQTLATDYLMISELVPEGSYKVALLRHVRAIDIDNRISN